MNYLQLSFSSLSLLDLSLLDDLISALISTILAIGISLYFYYKGNRNAFESDILVPIKKSKNKSKFSSKELEQIISHYTYRFAKSKEKIAIENLNKALKKVEANNFDDLFANAILDDFFSQIQFPRFHEIYSSEIGEYSSFKCYTNEPYSQIKEYSVYALPLLEIESYSEQNEILLTNRIHEILEDFTYKEWEVNTATKLLRVYSIEIIKTIKDSPYYRKYLEAQKALNEAWHDKTFN